MVTGKKKQLFTPENILSKVSEYDVYRYYLGQDFDLGIPILSPFRKENNPSFSIVCSGNGELKHKDFADSGKNGGIIDFVMQLHNEGFYEAMKRIDRDFGLGIQGTNKAEREVGIRPPTPPPLPRTEKIFQVVTGRWRKEELEYWSAYHITLEELKDNLVYPVRKLYINGKLMSHDNSLRFGYLFKDRWKIYTPFAPKKVKWFTNVPNSVISGIQRMEGGGEIGLITKAKKDEIILSKIIPCTCSTQNESSYSIPKGIILPLQESFEEIYVNFDADETGVKESKYYNQFGFKWINCPRGYVKDDGTPIKDFADLAKYHGLETVINYFKSKNLIE